MELRMTFYNDKDALTQDDVTVTDLHTSSNILLKEVKQKL